MTDDSEDRKFVEMQVLRYLLAHPAAADSAEGVRHWWLRDAGEVSPTMLTEVLEALSLRGWLISRGDNPENRIYALNTAEVDAVRTFVTGSGERLHG